TGADGASEDGVAEVLADLDRLGLTNIVGGVGAGNAVVVRLRDGGGVAVVAGNAVTRNGGGERVAAAAEVGVGTADDPGEAGGHDALAGLAIAPVDGGVIRRRGLESAGVGEG